MDVVCDYILEDEKIKEWNTFINRKIAILQIWIKENPRVGDKIYYCSKKSVRKIFEAEVENP